MLLEILRPLEGLAAKITFVWLERNMYANVGSDVITLHSRCATSTPLTSEVQIVGTLASDVALTYVVLRTR